MQVFEADWADIEQERARRRRRRPPRSPTGCGRSLPLPGAFDDELVPRRRMLVRLTLDDSAAPHRALRRHRHPHPLHLRRHAKARHRSVKYGGSAAGDDAGDLEPHAFGLTSTIFDDTPSIDDSSASAPSCAASGAPAGLRPAPARPTAGRFARHRAIDPRRVSAAPLRLRPSDRPTRISGRFGPRILTMRGRSLADTSDTSAISASIGLRGQVAADRVDAEHRHRARSRPASTTRETRRARRGSGRRRQFVTGFEHAIAGHRLQGDCHAKMRDLSRIAPQ